jgi:hypothetical protein
MPPVYNSYRIPRSPSPIDTTSRYVRTLRWDPTINKVESTYVKNPNYITRIKNGITKINNGITKVKKYIGLGGGSTNKNKRSSKRRNTRKQR